MGCFTLGCDGEVVGRVTYQTSMASKHTEYRCKDCMREVYENLNNTIIETEWHDDEDAIFDAETSSAGDEYVILDESEKTESEVIEDLENRSPVVFKNTISVGTPYYKVTGNELTHVTVLSTSREQTQGVSEAYDILCERLGVSMDKLEAEHIIENNIEFANCPWDSMQELRDLLSSWKSVMAMSMEVYPPVVFEITPDIPFEAFKAKVKSYYSGLDVIQDEDAAKVVVEP